MPRLAYFAHPIDQWSSGAAKREALILSSLARHFDFVFDPAQAFIATDAPFDERVQRINFAALCDADAVFAWLPRGVPTVGTVAEILDAQALGIPVMVYCESRPIGLGEAPGVQFFETDALGDDPTVAVTVLSELANGGRTKGTNELLWAGPEGGLVPPKRQGDAGYDLVTAEARTLHVGQRATIDCQVHLAGPDSVWYLVVARSSSWARGLAVEPGVIDAGYRGDMKVKVLNVSTNPIEIQAGERIAQIIPLPILAQALAVQHVEMGELPEGDRGLAGWGSSGA